MALGPRLDLRQSQSLVMTPQLQQAIKLLAASNLEIETFIAEALEANPLLEAGDVRQVAAAPAGDAPELPPEAPTADELMLRGRGEADAPLDLAGAPLDRDVDTGDGARSLKDAEWGASGAGGAGDADGDFGDFFERQAAELTLREHLEAQVGGLARDPAQDFAARHIIGLLDDAGYLPFALDEIAADLGIDETAAEAALRLVQSLDPARGGSL